MKVFKDLSEMGENVGKELGVTEWQTITQEQINDFAEATGDLQWIHTKPLKAKFGPFGTTIAHGFLVLSLAPRMLEDTYVVKSAKMGVNYGLNRVRFTAPVPVNSEIRGRVTLKSFEKMIKNYTIKCTLSKTLKGTSRGVHSHHFHASLASK